MKKGKQIYGKVEGISDIRKINEKIRGNVRSAKSRPRLTELHKRSSYLCTLTHSPAWKKSFIGKISKVRQVAKTEYTKTAKAINAKAKRLGLKANYDTKWGK